MDLLKNLNRDEGITIVVVTHEGGVANETNKIVHIKDGLIGTSRKTSTIMRIEDLSRQVYSSTKKQQYAVLQWQQ